jgi:hypothetical protein
MTTYNGWTNRETWLINLYLEPNTEADVDFAMEYMEDLIDGIDPLLRDFIDLSLINWEELKDALDKEEEDTEREGDY